MSDGRARHTPGLTSKLKARVILFDESLAPFIGEQITQLTRDYGWVEVGDSVQDIIDAAYVVVDSYYGDFMVGSIASFLGSVPGGWLALDGSTYDVADYPELALMLDAVFVDSGAGTFTLPDMRGAFIAGAGSSYSVGDAGGEASHVLTVSEMPAHDHLYTMPNQAVDIGSVGTPIPGVTSVTPGTTTSSAGSGDAHENRPPFVAVNFAVFAGRV